MIKKAEMNEEELRWRRRSDARTLAEAEMIRNDKERYKEAIRGAREVAQERVEEVRGICHVAGMQVPKLPSNAGVPANTPQPQVFDRRSYKNPATIGRL